MGRGDRGVQVGGDGRGQGAIALEAFGKTEDFDRFDGVGFEVGAGVAMAIVIIKSLLD